MYTGPEFILQIRMAQVLSTIFITMTFSSGMPLLYLVCVATFSISFWIDKILLLRYFRITSGYTKYITANLIDMLPLAVVVHILFGLLMLSSPRLLSSGVNTGIFGGAS